MQWGPRIGDHQPRQVPNGKIACILSFGEGGDLVVRLPTPQTNDPSVVLEIKMRAHTLQIFHQTLWKEVINPKTFSKRRGLF